MQLHPNIFKMLNFYFLKFEFYFDLVMRLSFIFLSVIFH